MDNKQKALEALKKANIEYEYEEHEPLFTIEACVENGLFDKCDICKNLFICDDKGKVHYLVIAPGQKPVDLKKLADQLGEKKLRFGSDKRLMKYLGVTPGSVSPFTVINDEYGDVIVVLDRDLQKLGTLGFHPNDNTGTCMISHADLLKFLKGYDNEVRTITLQ